MAVQLHHYPSSENRGDRVRGMECGVDQRGFLVSQPSQGVFLGKNAFQVPGSMAGANQYHLFNQLTSGGRQGYATQQQLDAAALLNGVTEKEQIHAANVMMSSGSRKRTRDQQVVEEFCGPWSNVATTPQPQQQQFVINGVTQLDTQHGSVVNPHSATNGVSTGLRLASFERSASPVSTSGRSVDPKPTWSDNFASHLQQERDEVAQLLKIQNEQLKSFIEEKRQRHARQVIAAAEEGFQRQMREKDAEMERVRRQNQELMERSAQLNAESQHWQSKARSTEAMVSVLRSNLAQAQAQNAAAPALVLGQQQQQHNKHCLEGCGDSDGAGALGAGAADDCASSYVDDVNDAHTRARNENRELREQRTCRVCRCNDVSMLLLPCRHLCLCHECEGQLAACPLCRTPKNASVQVYMS